MDDTTIARQKEQIRRELLQTEAFHNAPPPRWGKAAERLRRLPSYRTAPCLLIPPLQAFRQIALNALTDGKRLILTTPQLQSGFSLVDPRAVPPHKRPQAVYPHRSNPFAQRIDYRTQRPPRVDLILTSSLAVARDGSRLGDGSGHLDLLVACLSQLGWLKKGTRIVTVVAPFQIVSPLPMKRTDVGVHWVLSDEETIATGWNQPLHMPLLWPRLDRKRIRRNDVLFYLSRKRSRHP
ncbi:5-formyltetrahydrofolate cyclo-ligase [Desulfacinum hydrothermale DSM 13146]|uniref:5-formyltetrahydrofolate cyclo-ligase n=1 Tax=Desulfacinum hydrothermale DSM 13146 TaxID=1121390 RepID=A0A1W1X129_9BACT|nr:5-formyltetrahydrofolate cyclo-ligase [Desulfacinum hydrothermale]SMC17607.1 5-formyltetrahydrofolate cyclo-ligase [Desulfacinum hydrothermale DSM 13146]